MQVMPLQKSSPFKEVTDRLSSIEDDNLLFSAMAGKKVSSATLTIYTTGFSNRGIGAARYIYDNNVNTAYVSSNTFTSFLMSDGRGFRIDPSQPLTLEMFGAKGDGVSDDTSAIQAGINLVSFLGGGVLQGISGKTYVTTKMITLTKYVKLDLNGSKILAKLSDGTPEDRLASAFKIRSNATLQNGTIEVQSSGTPSLQGGAHSPIVVGSHYGSGGSVQAPNEDDYATGWTIRDLILSTNKNVAIAAAGSIPAHGLGGVAVAMIGGVNNGLIEGITIPDNAFMAGGIHADWGFLGLIDSGDIAGNKTRFNAVPRTGMTTHPNNIIIRNIKIGRLTRVNVGIDTGSHGVRLSGCHDIIVENVKAAYITYAFLRHTAGDLGFEYADELVKPFACKNIVFRNCGVEVVDTGRGIYSDSLADNVERAATSAFGVGSINGTTLTVTSMLDYGSGTGAFAVGRTLRGAGIAPNTTITALGTGTGGVGTYTVSVSQKVDATGIRASSSYSWMMNPLHYTNIVFENIVLNGTKSQNAIDGIYFIQQYGGTAIRCDAMGFRNGAVFESMTKDCRFIGCRTNSNRNHGVYAEHGPLPPTNCSIEGHISTRNASDAGSSEGANVFIGATIDFCIKGGTFGADSGETSKYGIYTRAKNDGTRNLTIIEDPYIGGHAANGVAVSIGSEEAFGTLRVITGLRYGPGVTNQFNGLAIVPVRIDSSTSGESKVYRCLRERLTGDFIPPATFQGKLGDVIELRNPAENSRTICTQTGTPGNWSPRP